MLEEAEKLQEERLVGTNDQPTPSKMYLHYPPEKCRKEINCYKELYKIGKTAKIHPSSLFELVGLGKAIHIRL